MGKIIQFQYMSNGELLVLTDEGKLYMKKWDRTRYYWQLVLNEEPKP